MIILSQDLPLAQINFSQEGTAKIIDIKICFLFFKYQFFRFINCMTWQSFSTTFH